MAVVSTQLQSSLEPDEVLRILTDFGPDRSRAWPGVDDEHLQVHDQGPGWADVTEGNKTTWERETYRWDAQVGMVTATTTDSNVWATGSGWEYRLTPDGDGTSVEVTLKRIGKNVKGKAIAALLPVIGKRYLAMTLRGPLQAR